MFSHTWMDEWMDGWIRDGWMDEKVEHHFCTSKSLIDMKTNTENEAMCTYGTG